MDVVIDVKGLYKYYFLKNWVVKALQGITLSVGKGEYLSVMGPSGSGKTTLFNMLGGLDRPTKGTVLVDGVNLYSLNSVELARFRCYEIGYIFQSFNLIPSLTALDNVMLPMIFAGLSLKDRVKKAKELLEQVGLGNRADHRPDELSGGQQQRVAITRALANDPNIILADEPTANLDLETGLKIVNLLKDVSLNRGVTVVCATHDLKMIGVSDKIAWIRDGRLERVEPRRSVELTADDLLL